jgi:predicted trehalose synthase
MVASISEKERRREASQHTIDIEPDPTLEDMVRYTKRWEEKIEEAMFDGYLQRSKYLKAPYILSKKDNGDFPRSLVEAWKIEKALLETMYELSHRIQNLIIPLDGILACI